MGLTTDTFFFSADQQDGFVPPPSISGEPVVPGAMYCVKSSSHQHEVNDLVRRHWLNWACEFNVIAFLHMKFMPVIYLDLGLVVLM